MCCLEGREGGAQEEAGWGGPAGCSADWGRQRADGYRPSPLPPSRALYRACWAWVRDHRVSALGEFVTHLEETC